MSKNEFEEFRVEDTGLSANDPLLEEYGNEKVDR